MSSMAKYVNSFSLLDDEEEDVTTLVDNLFKKVDNSQKDNESSQSVHDESGRSGSRDDNYSRDGSWGAIEDDGVAIEDVGHQQGESNESTVVDQTEKENDGWQDVTRSNRKGYANNGGSFGDGQWKNYKSETISHRRGRRADDEQFYSNDASNGQKRRYNIGNRGFGGDRRVNGHHQVKDNHDGDGQMRYRKGNQGYGGDRRGNGDNQVQGNDGGDAQMRYRNGNRSHSDQAQDGGAADGKNSYRNGNRGGYGGRRRGYYRDQVKDNDAGSGEQNGEGEVFVENIWGGEETTYRSRNWNYNGERRGRGGYKGRVGRGRSEFRRTGSDEVKEASNADDEHNANTEYVNGSGGDAAVVLNDSEVVVPEEEKNASEVVSGDVSNPTENNKSEELGHKRKDNEEARQRKKEEEEKEAALMTLDQYYEKLRSEKRKLLELEAQKTEVRRVAIDKDFEKMHLFERKQDDIDDRWFSIRKPKMERVKGQVSAASKTADTNDNDAKLKIEEIPNMTVKVEKEKGRKPVVVEAHEIFTSAFRPRRFGGRGGERGDRRDGGRGRAGGHSRGEQGGRGTEQGRFKDQINESVPQNYSDAHAPCRRRAPLPRPEDFPELAPGASSEGA